MPCCNLLRAKKLPETRSGCCHSGFRQFLWKIGRSGLQVFLQAQALRHDLLRSFFSNIPVMPGFIAYAGEVSLVFRIAEDKPVFRAVFHQPLLFRGIFLFFHQKLVIF